MQQHPSKAQHSSSNSSSAALASAPSKSKSPRNITPDMSQKGTTTAAGHHDDDEPYDPALATARSQTRSSTSSPLANKGRASSSSSAPSSASSASSPCPIARQALRLGFSSRFLANRTSAQIHQLLSALNSVRSNAAEETGLDPPLSEVASLVERAVEEMGLAPRFLGGKTEEEVRRLLLLSKHGHGGANNGSGAENYGGLNLPEGEEAEADEASSGEQGSVSNSSTDESFDELDAIATATAAASVDDSARITPLANATAMVMAPSPAPSLVPSPRVGTAPSPSPPPVRFASGLLRNPRVRSREGATRRRSGSPSLTLGLSCRSFGDKGGSESVREEESTEEGPRADATPTDALAKKAERATPPSSSSSSSMSALDKSNKARWERNMKALREYKRRHGHVDVPYREGKLGRFVAHQRAYYKKGSGWLTDERIGELERLGFKWSMVGSGAPPCSKTTTRPSTAEPALSRLESNGTSVTFSDEDMNEDNSMSEGHEDIEESDHDRNEHDGHESAEEEELGNVGEDDASSSDEQEEEASSGEESNSDDDNDGEEEEENASDVEVEKDSSDVEAEVEECANDSEQEEEHNEEESVKSDNDESDVDEGSGSDSEESTNDDDDKSMASSSAEDDESDEDEGSVTAVICDDDDESSVTAAVVCDDDSDSSANRPLARRGMRLPSRPLSDKANRGRPTVAKPATRSRFGQWMGRKKAAVPIMKPQGKRNPLCQERWQRNIVALKAFKARYGDTNVPSNYGSLGTFVRNTRALYNTPTHAKRWTLTEERKQMLEEMDFVWSLPKLKTTHAYRKRSRNISRAASTITAMNEMRSTMHLKSVNRQKDTTNQKAAVSKKIAQHVINMETLKLEGNEPLAKRSARKLVPAHDGHLKIAFREALLVGVSELDLYHAFEEIDQREEVCVASVVDDNSPHLSLHPSQESNSFQEWLSDRKGKWRQGQQRCRKRKRVVEESQSRKPLETVEEGVKEGDDDPDRPKLLLSHVQPKEGFNVWLADRKKRWKEQQQKRWAETAYSVEETCRLSVQSIDQFQQWLGDRKIRWRRHIQRKRRKTEHDSKHNYTFTHIERNMPLDYRSVGVRQTASGKWEVAFRYHGARRNLGTYDTQDQAALANEVGRKMLKTEIGKSVTEEEIVLNIKKARDAVLDAVHKSKKQQVQKQKAQQTQQLRQKPQPIQAINFRTCGVRQTRSGKWAVEISHKSKLRHIGTFLKQDQAALANKISREMLAENDSESLSAEEVNENVRLARDAALKAVSRSMRSSPRGGATKVKSKAVCAKKKVMKSEVVVKDPPKATEEAKQKKVVKRPLTEKKPPKAPTTNTTNSTKMNSNVTNMKHNLPAGLRQRSSNGKWEVVTYYHGKKRQIGTFTTQEEGRVANKIARERLKTEKGASKPSDDEIERIVRSARKAALDAASRVAIGKTNPGATAIASKTTVSKLSQVSLSEATKSKPAGSLEEANKATKTASATEHSNKPSNDVVSTEAKDIDFRSLGVRQTPSGKWEVGFRYHGNRRTLGTYDSQDHAALANEVGRKMLMADKEKSSKLTAEEVERNMKQARNAAFKAVSNIQEDIPPNEEDMFNLILMVDEVASMESGERPNLALSRSQPKKIFGAWLSDKKYKWKRQRPKKPKNKHKIIKAKHVLKPSHTLRPNTTKKPNTVPLNSKSCATSEPCATAPKNSPPSVPSSPVSSNPLLLLPNRCSFGDNSAAQLHLVPQTCPAADN